MRGTYWSDLPKGAAFQLDSTQSSHQFVDVRYLNENWHIIKARFLLESTKLDDVLISLFFALLILDTSTYNLS